jgi:hypothetical protein
MERAPGTLQEALTVYADAERALAEAAESGNAPNAGSNFH